MLDVCGDNEDKDKDEDEDEDKYENGELDKEQCR